MPDISDKIVVHLGFWLSYVFAVHGYWKSGHDHFYTTDMTEIGVINVGMTGNHGYKYEGVGFRVLANQEEGTKALNRYWHADSTDHFYTTNLKEINVTDVGAVGNHGYKLEGTLGFCFSNPTTGTIPLHRYYSKPHIDHFYTTKFQKSYGGNAEWKYDGIQCYVYPA